MKKVLFVVDISNLYYTVRKNLGGAVDYEKLKKSILEPDEEFYRVIAYGAYLDKSSNSFIQLLQHLGYETKYKEVRSYVDETGLVQRKADWDVGIAMDVVIILDQVDTVVFATADGDMVHCLDYVNSRGRKCRIIGSGISNQLKDACNSWQEIGKSLLRDSNEFDQSREQMGVRDSLSSNAS